MQSNDVNAAAVNGKEAAYFGVPWEDAYGYAQAIKVGDTIHVSCQLSHDETGNLIAPASLDESGKPAEFSMMEQQMRATYANAVKLLARFGATLDNVVEETLYVLDVDPHSPPRARCARRPTARHDLSAPAA
jgi:enamine deaminase RidA (YjgF/YER057c/UK114 family)